MLGYPDVYQAGDDVAEIVEFQPIGLEGIDHKLIDNMQTKGMHTRALRQLPEGKGWLMVQFPGESQEEADARAHDLIAKLKRKANPPTIRFYDDKNDEKAVWALRETSVGATAFVPGQAPGVVGMGRRRSPTCPGRRLPARFLASYWTSMDSTARCTDTSARAAFIAESPSI